jgi:hypothetical protein
MGKSKSLGGTPSLVVSGQGSEDAITSESRGGVEGSNTNMAGSNEKEIPPPQAKEAKENDDIASLTEGLGSVSIGLKPDVYAPESIKNVAELLLSDKFKNIVVLTGAGISCNAGIPGEYTNVIKHQNNDQIQVL